MNTVYKPLVALSLLFGGSSLSACNTLADAPSTVTDKSSADASVELRSGYAGYGAFEDAILVVVLHNTSNILQEVRGVIATLYSSNEDELPDKLRYSIFPISVSESTDLSEIGNSAYFNTNRGGIGFFISEGSNRFPGYTSTSLSSSFDPESPSYFEPITIDASGKMMLIISGEMGRLRNDIFLVLERTPHEGFVGLDTGRELLIVVPRAN
jgi:hypothetical protein